MDFSKLNFSEEALQNLMVKEAKLGLTPGRMFENNHTQHLRMNIASPFTKIQKAFHQIKKTLDSQEQD